VGESGGITVGKRGLVAASSSPGTANILAQLEEEAGTVQQVGTILSILNLTVSFIRVICTRVVDPDSMTLCIRIRNPDPDPWARKMKKKIHFSLTFKTFL
jgi:hypothetical protein